MTQLNVSNYAPDDCEIGVVHVGLGAFHRAHQAVYFDALMGQSGDLSWGITAVNLRSADSDTFAASAQSNGYVLRSIAADGVTENHLIRVHQGYEDWSKNLAASDLVALPSVQIITITVTESGYSMLPDNCLNLNDPVIAKEVAGNPGTTIYAFLRESLHSRMVAKAGPITVMCCDNLRHNGRLLSQNFQTYLTACGDTELLEWLDHNTSFPSSMVDRITPKTSAALQDEITGDFDLDNLQAVICEDFIQWVIEDNFAGKRPALDTVGVELVADVEPYEETKIRVLNGGHTCLAYLGALAGYKTYDQAMADPELAKHFVGYQNLEVLPALGPDLPLDLNDYLATVTSRFKNPNIADTIERICFDGVSKMGIFILPTVSKCFETGLIPTFGITSIASWYVLAKCVSRGGLNFNYVDPNKKTLEPFFDDPTHNSFATAQSLWRDLPQTHPAFVTLLTAEIDRITEKYTDLDTARSFDTFSKQDS